MKFSCYKNDLSDALKLVIRAADPKPSTPITAGVFIKAENSLIELQANNFSLGIISKIPAYVEVEGSTVVSAKRLAEFVKNMPDDTLTFTIENSSAVFIESGGASVKLLTMNPDDFPRVNPVEAARSIKLPATTFSSLVRRTVFAVGNDDSRPIFTGVLFKIQNSILSLTASNTHRLAFAEKIFSEDYPDLEFVVPAETLKGILEHIDSKSDEKIISIDYNERNLTFAFDNFVVASRLLEGVYPPVEKILDEEAPNRARVETAELKQAVGFIALMAKETEYKSVQFVFAGDCVEISANSNDIGGAVRNIEAQIEGDGISISFNVNYIADVLKIIDTPQIFIDFKEKFAPIKITEPGNENFIYVVTPVRA